MEEISDYQEAFKIIRVNAYGLLTYVRPSKLSIIQTGNDAMHFDRACALCIRVRIHLWFHFELHNKAQLKPHCYHSNHSQLMDLVLCVFACTLCM